MSKWMTREEFVAYYLNQSEITDPAARKAFMKTHEAVTCDCDSAICKGWIIIPMDIAVRWVER